MSGSIKSRDAPASVAAQGPAAAGALPRHYESSREISVSAEALFTHLDDHVRLSGHMSKSSWMMAGSRMEIALDDGQGKSVGSRITLKGRVMGLPLSVEEVVTEHTPPVRKVWQTIGAPRLLVIGHYRMGFDITPEGPASRVRVFIDYALPEGVVARLLGQMLGRVYARWCTDQMANDAVNAFSRNRGARSG